MCNRDRDSFKNSANVASGYASDSQISQTSGVPRYCAKIPFTSLSKI